VVSIPRRFGDLGIISFQNTRSSSRSQTLPPISTLRKWLAVRGLGEANEGKANVARGSKGSVDVMRRC